MEIQAFANSGLLWCQGKPGRARTSRLAAGPARSWGKAAHQGLLELHVKEAKRRPAGWERNRHPPSLLTRPAGRSHPRTTASPGLALHSWVGQEGWILGELLPGWAERVKELRKSQGRQKSLGRCPLGVSLQLPEGKPHPDAMFKEFVSLPPTTA
ncbi:hypothetical protein P7K49_030569, partial [Saguinus oedipus]